MVKPARSSATAMLVNACRAWPPASPGKATTPSTVDVVPLTQAVSPRTTTRL
jgi:hypothetical protein